MSNIEGTVGVGGVREFVDALVKDLRRNDDGTSTCRVVYTRDPWGTHTQYLRVTEREAADLKDLAAKLDAEQPPASSAAAATPATVPDTSGTVAKPSSRGYALQVDGKTVATLLLPVDTVIDITCDTATTDGRENADEALARRGNADRGLQGQRESNLQGARPTFRHHHLRGTDDGSAADRTRRAHNPRFAAG